MVRRTTSSKEGNREIKVKERRGKKGKINREETRDHNCRKWPRCVYSAIIPSL